MLLLISFLWPSLVSPLFLSPSLSASKKTRDPTVLTRGWLQISSPKVITAHGFWRLSDTNAETGGMDCGWGWIKLRL